MTMRNNVTGTDNQQGSRPFQRIDPSETTCRIPQMSTSLARVLAFLYTDGCVSPKGKSWRIYFAVKSKVLADLFHRSLAETFAIEEGRVRRSYTRDRLEKAVVDSKEIGTYLVSRFGTFRTLQYQDGAYPNTSLPVADLIICHQVAEFLRVAFSCDGGVSFYPARRSIGTKTSIWMIRTVFLSCKHPVLRSQYLHLLHILDVKAREVPKDGKIKIESEHEIRKFQSNIGFVPGTEITGNSKFWNRNTKQEVLAMMVNSYGHPSEIYQQERFQLR